MRDRFSGFSLDSLRLFKFRVRVVRGFVGRVGWRYLGLIVVLLGRVGGIIGVVAVVGGGLVDDNSEGWNWG